MSMVPQIPSAVDTAYGSAANEIKTRHLWEREKQESAQSRAGYRNFSHRQQVPDLIRAFSMLRTSVRCLDIGPNLVVGSQSPAGPGRRGASSDDRCSSGRGPSLRTRCGSRLPWSCFEPPRMQDAEILCCVDSVYRSRRLKMEIRNPVHALILMYVARL